MFKSFIPYLLNFTILLPLHSSALEPVNFVSEGQKLTLKLIKEKLGIPWGFDFLPDNQNVIINSRDGKMRILNLESLELTDIKGVPPVTEKGQGGLLDVAVHPDFKSNQLLFFTYSASYSDGVGTTVARARLNKNQLEDLKILFRSEPPGDTGQHFGSRIVFADNNTLFFGIGDRGDRDKAQSLEYPNGKVFRIYQDGNIPKDNPFINNKKAIAAIWSLGHRNPQGLYKHPLTGELWEQEHGPRGGDEINLIKKGLNYGWPVITYGREYYGPKIGTTHKEGLEQPIKYWVPSIAPSSLMIYSGKLFKNWKGNFFSGALVLQHLNRLELKNNKEIKEERLFENLKERIRNVKEAPNGEIYFSTDSGKLFKIIQQMP